jgi:hypothetical protein
LAHSDSQTKELHEAVLKFTITAEEFHKQISVRKARVMALVGNNPARGRERREREKKKQ